MGVKVSARVGVSVTATRRRAHLSDLSSRTCVTRMHTRVTAMHTRVPAMHTQAHLSDLFMRLHSAGCFCECVGGWVTDC